MFDPKMVRVSLLGSAHPSLEVPLLGVSFIAGRKFDTLPILHGVLAASPPKPLPLSENR